MNKEFDQMLTRLRAITVAQVSKVVAKDQDLASFTSKDGFTVFDDDPEFERERAWFTDQEWRRTEKFYIHYFGFTNYTTKTSVGEGPIYFQKNDYDMAGRLDIIVPHDRNVMLSPPDIGEWVAGEIVKVPKKGLRFSVWVKVSRFEVYVRSALLSRSPLAPHIFQEMETSKNHDDYELINFARLIVNGDITHYLNLKRTASNQVRFCDIDLTVYNVTRLLRSELWDEYVAVSLAEKLYSSIIPEPGPKPISDNLNGFSEKVGLSTPFNSLRL